MYGIFHNDRPVGHVTSRPAARTRILRLAAAHSPPIAAFLASATGSDLEDGDRLWLTAISTLAGNSTEYQFTFIGLSMHDHCYTTRLSFSQLVLGTEYSPESSPRKSSGRSPHSATGDSARDDFSLSPQMTEVELPSEQDSLPTTGGRRSQSV